VISKLDLALQGERKTMSRNAGDLDACFVREKLLSFPHNHPRAK
jgi:hypothetical protein